MIRLNPTGYLLIKCDLNSQQRATEPNLRWRVAGCLRLAKHGGCPRVTLNLGLPHESGTPKKQDSDDKEEVIDVEKQLEVRFKLLRPKSAG